MREALAEWRARHFAVFAGASADITLPIPQAVVNQVIATEVLPRVPALGRLDVLIRPDNRLDVVVASGRFRWMPPLTVPLRVEPDVAPGPRLRMQVHGGGLAALLAPWAARLGEGRVRGVTLDERRIEIDVLALLPPTDAQTLAIWFHSGAVHTDAGVLWISARLARPHGDAPQGPP